MPTRGSPFIANFFYHVYNRGVDKGAIFFSEENYLYFLRLLKKNLERYAVNVVAYCLMPNHFHFLLSPVLDDNISRFMKSLLGSYSQALNKQRQRSGPLFQGRFQSILVDRGEYIIHLARYIHLNPVKAGLVSSLDEWCYSNYLDVIGLRSGKLKDASLVPERFASGDDYRKFVEEYWEETKEPKDFEGYLLD